jgi:hypothetical protein
MCQPNSAENRLIHFTYSTNAQRPTLVTIGLGSLSISCIIIRRSVKSRVPKLIDYSGVVLVLKFEVCK